MERSIEETNLISVQRAPEPEEHTKKGCKSMYKDLSPSENFAMWKEFCEVTPTEEKTRLIIRGAVLTPDQFFIFWLIRAIGRTPTAAEYEELYDTCTEEEKRVYMKPEVYERIYC